MAELLSVREERAGGCSPAESHNQIIAVDSSFVYRAVTKGQLPSKNSHKAESSDNLRCLITVLSKPSALPLKTSVVIMTEDKTYNSSTSAFYLWFRDRFLFERELMKKQR